MNFGNFKLTDDLCPGGNFYGYRVDSFKTTEAGVVWVFSRSNKGFVFPMPYDEFFDLISSPHKAEFIRDQMQESLARSFAGSMGIVVAREDN